MIRVIKGVGLGAALCCAALGFAGQAAAEELTGTYTRVMGGEDSMFQSQVTYTPCGPGCIHAQTSGTAAYDLTQQGGVWAGTYALDSGTPCTVTLDPVAMTEHHVCVPGTDVVMTLTPGG